MTPDEHDPAADLPALEAENAELRERWRSCVDTIDKARSLALSADGSAGFRDLILDLLNGCVCGIGFVQPGCPIHWPMEHA